MVDILNKGLWICSIDCHLLGVEIWPVPMEKVTLISKVIKGRCLQLTTITEEINDGLLSFVNNHILGTVVIAVHKPDDTWPS